MSLFSIQNITIKSIAACVPSRKKKVQDYNYISKKEQELFSKSTGIKESRVADKHICTSDMCYEAAKKIIQDQDINKDEIDILIFVSQSPDYFLPATSIILQEKLGLNNNTIALDINLGCSGYIYGLSIIANMLSLNGMKKGLLLCGDKSSLSTNIKDKSTYPLFGDAGCATLLEQNKSANPLFFNLQSDGSGKEAIIIKGGATRNPIDENTTKEIEIEPQIIRSSRDLILNGVEVFNFSLREVKPNVLDLLKFSKKSIENLDFLVMHQANKLMNESVRKKLKIPKEKVPYSLEKFGNTSSASIPLTMVTELAEQLKEPQKLLLSGFGVGFSWGSLYFESEKINVSPLIEI